jgi:molybdate/tungstate transport system ATP-binding protein
MLELKNIYLQLGNFSLKSISFSVEKGDYFILLGVSGAGKTMILETIAGLVTPGSGSVYLEDWEITREKIQNRGVGLVFQDHAIFPHMTVRENIAYSLHGKIHNSEKKSRIESAARQMKISSMLDRRPATLSGGELQRVALARTLVQRPKILLLDEPLASMDVQLRGELRSLLRQLNRNGQTIIHVTHDYDEAISLGNRIAVMHDGSILQQGTPEEVFHFPTSEFVAHFTGAKNFFPAKSFLNGESNVVHVNEKVKIKVAGEELSPEGFIILRNEDIFLSNSEVETSAVNNFKGIIKELVPSRSGVEVTVDIGIILYVLITHESVKNLCLAENSTVWVHFKATAVRFLKKY